MAKQTDKKPDTVRVSKATVHRASQIAKWLRVVLYLGIGLLLFTKVRAADVASGVKFERQTLQIGSQKIDVEIADTDAKRSQGLMYRKELKDGKGMLFIFPEERTLSFWMRNTLIPLSIGYFGRDKKLIETLDMTPASPMDINPPTYPSSRSAMYALEVPLGWFKKYKINPGAQFILSRP